jgi:two-component system, OmpR family, response regulator ResD
MTAEYRFAFIIEDDEKLAYIFSEALQAAGYLAEVIQNGSHALVRMGSLVPEIVVLDLQLPGTNGIDILKFIRAEKRFELTQVIVTTGDQFGAMQVYEIADFVLIKPVSFVHLRDLVARIELNPRNTC